MTTEEKQKFELLIEAVNKIQEVKNIIVRTKEYQLAATLRDFEKQVQQSLSDFLNISRTYSADDLQKAFYAGRSGISTTPEQGERLKDAASYPTFDVWFKSGWHIAKCGIDDMIRDYLQDKSSQIHGD